MGVITALFVLVAVYIGFHVAAKCFHGISYAALVCEQVVLAVFRAAHMLSKPPGSSWYDGSPTAWSRAWSLLSLGPLFALFAPGSFASSYVLLVAPALVVAAVALTALLVRNGAVAALRRCWRVMLAAAACVLSGLLLDDALRAHVAVGRYFSATLRGSTACLVGFCGLVGLLGPPESGGFSSDQTREWLRALALTAGAATSGVGAGTLLLTATALFHSSTITIMSSGGGDGDGDGDAVAANAAAAAAAATTGYEGASTALRQRIDQLSFMLYGIVLLLIAAGCISSLTEARMPLLWLVGQGLRALMRVRQLLAAAVRLVGWMSSLQVLRSAVTITRRTDQAVTRLVTEGIHWAVAAAMMLWSALRRGPGRVTSMLVQHLLVQVGGLLQPLLRGFVAGLRVLVSELHAVCLAVYHQVLCPAFRAIHAAALRIYCAVVRPLAAEIWSLLRLYLAPLMWPAGTAAAASLFLREAVAARAVMPYGAAGAVSAIIVALMAGKTLRKSRLGALSSLGGLLERYATAAYLHLDLGLSKPVVRVLRNTMAAAVLTAQLLMATGRQALALLLVPLAAVLTASLTLAAWLWHRVGRVLYPWMAAAWRWGSAVATAVWSHPEWSLVLAAALLAASYAAHAAHLPAAAGRLAAEWGGTVVAAGARGLSRQLAPLLHRLATLMGRAATLLGLSRAVSARAVAAAAAVLAGWGRRCGSGTDLALLFRSESFAGAFLGLNLLHAVALKGWAVPALAAQGPAGRAAVSPVISFVARSSGKVALGPMYLTAAASFLAGGQSRLAGRVAAHAASLTTPVLWALYLAALWLEGVRRLSYDPRNSNNSEFSRAVQAVRYAGGWLCWPSLLPSRNCTGPINSSITTTTDLSSWSWSSTPRSSSLTLRGAPPSATRAISMPATRRRSSAAATNAAATTNPTATSVAAPTQLPGAPHLALDSALDTGGATATHAAVTVAATSRVAPAGSLPVPTAPSGTADKGQKYQIYERLLQEIRAQAFPGYIFHADSCMVCLELLHSTIGAKVGVATSSDTSSSSRLQQHREQQGTQREAQGWRGLRQAQHAGLGATAGSSGSGCSGGGARVPEAGQSSRPRNDGTAGEEGSAQGGVAAQQQLVLRCGHAFHESCVLEWLVRSPRCPVCREPAVGASRHTNMLF